jgi:peptide/nickel transport system permease protein
MAAVLVLVVSSAALWLIAAAPGDHLTDIDIPPETAEAERARLGLDRPFLIQYGEWFRRVLVLDLGESLKYHRPVQDLVWERGANTALLGMTALLLATVVGIPAGIWTGSSGGLGAAAARGASMLLVSIPPLVTSFVLLLLASYTRWLPVGGFGALSGDDAGGLFDVLRYVLLPSLALAAPVAAALERLQSQAMREALDDPSVQAARARGCSPARLVWRHALRLSLKPVVALYGVLVGTVLSGSFVVELVMSWPGLGALTYEALVSRDLYLVAGCAAAGSLFLALGVLASDLALAWVDPRLREPS